MELTELSKIGLTKGEIKVYLALLKNGKLSKSPLANKADVSSSKVYEIAEKLVRKGLASFFVDNKVTYYTANNPKFLKEYIKNKEKELQEEKKIVEDLMPTLQNFRKSSEQEVTFELLRGWEGIENAMMEGVDNAPNGSMIYGLGVQYPNVGFINRFHSGRLKKNIRLKIILPEEIDKRQNFKNATIRFISNLSVGMGIYPDRVLIQSIGKIPFNLLIKHPEMVKTFKVIFDRLWKNADKKLKK